MPAVPVSAGDAQLADEAYDLDEDRVAAEDARLGPPHGPASGVLGEAVGPGAVDHDDVVDRVLGECLEAPRVGGGQCVLDAAKAGLLDGGRLGSPRSTGGYAVGRCDPAMGGRHGVGDGQRILKRRLRGGLVGAWHPAMTSPAAC